MTQTCNPTSLSKLKTAVLLLLGACSIWLGFPNDVCFVPLVILLWPVSLAVLASTATKARTAYKHAFVLNLLGITATLYWLAYPIHDVGGLPWGLAALCMVLVAAALALLFALFSPLLYTAKKEHPIVRALFAATVWTALEIASANLLDFPWIPLTGGLVLLPSTVQIACFVGSYGTSFCWVFAVHLLCFPTTLGAQQQTRCSIACALSVLLLIMGFGLARTQQVHPSAEKQAITVLLVEGNFDQNEKWTPSVQRTTVERYRKLTYEGVRSTRAKLSLILWPETCMPFFLETNPLLARAIRDTARETATPLLFGIPGTDDPSETHSEKRHIYNRAHLLNARGESVGYADKEHLVPFGEYVPKILDIPFFQGLLQGVAYSPGTHTSPLRVNGIFAGMLICYEGIFPELAQKRTEAGANILVDLSNDAWFSNTPAASQHLYLKALRSIEQNRWLLRSTNSGISAVIDPLGRIRFQGPLFTQGVHIVRAALEEEHTFFHKMRTPLSALFTLLTLVAGLKLLSWNVKTRSARPHA